VGISFRIHTEMSGNYSETADNTCDKFGESGLHLIVLYSGRCESEC